jgi:hypothetical protein
MDPKSPTACQIHQAGSGGGSGDTRWPFGRAVRRSSEMIDEAFTTASAAHIANRSNNMLGVDDP